MNNLNLTETQKKMLQAMLYSYLDENKHNFPPEIEAEFSDLWKKLTPSIR